MRCKSGRFQPGYNGPALHRFVEKCRFDPITGCVIWIGGRTQGRGHSVPYGSFWSDGRRWFAHRWAAVYIHGLEIEGLQVDHCCPTIPIPNTLCVEHLQSVPAAINRELQWIRTQVGLLEPPPYCDDPASDAPIEHSPCSPPVWYVENGGLL